MVRPLQGDVETFEPYNMERFWTLAEHRHVYVDLRPEQAGHAMLTLLVDHDAFLAVGHRTGIEPESEET